MSDERWVRIDRLLQSALGRPLHEREAFIRDACTDDEGMRDEVLSLLAHAGSSDNFLEPLPGREPLQPGARLGAYEIRAQIGEGGMGEVYRAHDSRLRRDIALKILPPEAADAERRHRFAREAQAVAALNHPGIVTIHSVEQSGDIHFLTMELVDGQTLDVLIPAGGLPIDRLLAFAIPLADAVGAAHGQGIVHRDLKPTNVMVTRDGRVKVMDFGLAKLSRPATLQDARDDASVTTIAGRLTEDGRIFGTVAYMSPEQAEGRDVDHRSDVFSLGVLLFELATGRRPFKGDSQVALLASIVKDTPPPVTDLKPGVPADFARLVRKCLAKDPGRRYQSVLDLRNDLEELQQSPIVVAPTPVGRSTRRIVLIATAAVAIVTAVAAYLPWPTPHSETAPSDFQRFIIIPPQGIRIRPQEGQGAPLLAISPDGQWVAFTGTGGSEKVGLYLRPTNKIEATRIRAEESSSPFFSADSKWLAFWSNDKLWKVPVEGGTPEPICAVAGGLRGASWGDDNAIVYSERLGRLFRVSSDGPATPALIARPDSDDQRFYFPHVLPGSKSALVMLLPPSGEAEVAVVSLRKGETIHPLSLGAQPNWLGSAPQYVDLQGGWLVFRRSTRLYAAPFDLGQLNVTGEARPVFDEISYNPGGSETSAFSVSRTGALVYIPQPERVEGAQLTWFDGRKEEHFVKDWRDYGWPALDPKGERIAVHIAESGDSDLWVFDTRTGVGRQMTHGLAAKNAIAWTGDGKWIVFSSSPAGRPRLFRVLAEGGEPEQLTIKAEYGAFPNAYDVATSAYGNVVSFFRQVGLSDFDLLTVTVDPPGSPKEFLRTAFSAFDGQISPDGQWIAYVSTGEYGAGDRQIVVRSFPDGVSPVPIAPGESPRWSADGKQLFFRRGKQFLSVSFVSGRLVGTPQTVHTFADDGFAREHYVVAPNGRFLFVKRPQPARTERLLVYVPNWLAVARAAYSESK